MNNFLADDLDHIFSYTHDLWEELRGKRIFITGGSGFFGCWLLESFIRANDTLDLGAEAVVLIRDVHSFKKKVPHLANHNAIQFQIGDVRSFEFPFGDFSHVIHAATNVESGSDELNPFSTLDVIVQGTRRTLEFARQAKVKKFLFVSSGAVYGKQPFKVTHIEENYAGAPDCLSYLSTYGEGKRTAELLCALYSQEYQIETKIARCFTFVGPYQSLDSKFAIVDFMRDRLNERDISVRGDGTPHRSYLYAADLAIWLWSILFRGKVCRPYNVGSEVDLSIADLATMVANSFSPAVYIKVERKAADPKHFERYVPSTRRALLELGLKQMIDLPEAIRRTMQWHSNSRKYDNSLQNQDKCIGSL